MLARITLIGALAACSVPDGDYFGRIDRAERGHLRWCNSGEPDYLDPAKASSTVSSPLITTLFAGLTAYGMDGLPAKALATDWTISDDVRTYTFHLRRDAVWSNGRPVTAYDVAYSAMRVSHPLVASPNSDNIAPLDNVTAYLTRKAFVVRATGEIVEPTGDGVDIARRRGRVALALRDLTGGAAYATVPAGEDVTQIALSGTSIMPAAPDGKRWAYVYWARDAEGVYGWVPIDDLVEPDAAKTVEVRAIRTKDAPRAMTYGELLYDPRVLGVRVIDPYTIVLHATDPTPFVLPMTDNRALLTTPIEAVSRHPTRWTRPENIVTSGALRMVDWIERDRVELARNPRYWDQKDIGLERLTALAVDDQAAAANLYFTGACDATAGNNIPSTYLPALNGEIRGTAYKDFDVSPMLGIYFLWLNTEKLSDRHLRRALSLAIDRTAVPRFTHGNEIPTAQLTPGTPIDRLSPADLASCNVKPTDKGVALVMTSGELCYVPPPGLDYDVAKAKAELALAKHVPAKLRYTYNAGSEAHKQIAEYLQAQWKAIGIDVELEAQEWNAMLEASRKGEFEILRLGNIANLADTESEFLPLFRCGSPDNRGRYCNPEYERILDEARTIGDRKLRNAKIAEAERVMIEDAPVLPIYVYTVKHLIKPYVKNYAINPIDQPPLWKVRVE